MHCALCITLLTLGLDAMLQLEIFGKEVGKLGVGGVLFGMLVYGMWRLWEIGKVGRLKR